MREVSDEPQSAMVRIKASIAHAVMLKFPANRQRTYFVSLMVLTLASTPGSRVCGQGDTSAGSESKAKELWIKVRKAEEAMEAGSMDFHYHLGHQTDWPEVNVHAAWFKKHLVLSLVTPASNSADFEISGATVLDRGAGISRIITVTNLKQPSSDVIFLRPFKLSSIRAILQDPSSRAFDLVGSPDKVVDGGDEWIFSFPVPYGYSGPGYVCSVSKATMLPRTLSRKGEGMPELSIRYRLGSISKDFAKLPTFGKARKGNSPSFGIAYERSQFCRIYGHLFSTPPKGP